MAKNKLVTIRVTEEEKLRLEAQAAQSNLGLSAYVLQLVSAQENQAIADVVDIETLLDEVSTAVREVLLKHLWKDKPETENIWRVDDG